MGAHTTKVLVSPSTKAASNQSPIRDFSLMDTAGSTSNTLIDRGTTPISVSTLNSILLPEYSSAHQS